MTILSTITSLSNPTKINRSSISSSRGASLSMGSNSVACGGCGGGSSSGGSSGGAAIGVAVAVDINLNLSGVLGGLLGGGRSGSGSCGCH
ncbi:hypothetical protein RB653_003538 [Dictyostelium firmibasis]|uniref:Uncharacterized protein n=1 Tax=Dictyostelium firmibasis TaxID=79012 RepID=A0AAN7TZE3_9MYCE